MLLSGWLLPAVSDQQNGSVNIVVMETVMQVEIINKTCEVHCIKTAMYSTSLRHMGK